MGAVGGGPSYSFAKGIGPFRQHATHVDANTYASICKTPWSVLKQRCRDLNVSVNCRGRTAATTKFKLWNRIVAAEAAGRRVEESLSEVTEADVEE